MDLEQSFLQMGNSQPQNDLEQAFASMGPSFQPPASSDPWQNFLNTAQPIAEKSNFPMSVLAGQAALETGRGTSQMAKNKNNYFGFMAYDSNPGAARSYSDPSQSINDYINLIQNDPRYAKAWNNYLVTRDPVQLIQGIKAAGYATDPNYVSKILSEPEFKQYAK